MRESFKTSSAGSGDCALGVCEAPLDVAAGGGETDADGEVDGEIGTAVDGGVDGVACDCDGLADSTALCFPSGFGDVAGAVLWAGSPLLCSAMLTKMAAMAIPINDAIKTATRLVSRTRRWEPGGRSGSVIGW
jgi:hypothetical protein